MFAPISDIHLTQNLLLPPRLQPARVYTVASAPVGRLDTLTDWHKNRYREVVSGRLSIMPKDLRTTWGIGAPPRDVLAGVTALSHVTAVCPRLFRDMLRELRSGEFRPLDAFDVIKVEVLPPATRFLFSNVPACCTGHNAHAGTFSITCGHTSANSQRAHILAIRGP